MANKKKLILSIFTTIHILSMRSIVHGLTFVLVALLACNHRIYELWKLTISFFGSGNKSLSYHQNFIWFSGYVFGLKYLCPTWLCVQVSDSPILWNISIFWVKMSCRSVTLTSECWRPDTHNIIKMKLTIWAI